MGLRFCPYACVALLQAQETFQAQRLWETGKYWSTKPPATVVLLIGILMTVCGFKSALISFGIAVSLQPRM